MTNADLINKVLMEMTDVVDYDVIKKLKTYLERNFYNLTIIENSTEIVPIQKTDNETLFKRFLFERKVEGLSDRTLEQYAREDDCPYLFVNTRKVDGKIKQMTNESIESLVHRYCNKAHIRKTCNVHLFRKTLATRLYKRGLDISIIAKILGHNSVKTTEKYYLTICDSDINYLYHKCS